MKFILSALIAAFCAVSIEAVQRQTEELPDKIKASSPIGKKLLENARRLEGNYTEFNENWLAGFSIVFQGCHHISQWNDNIEAEDDVRIATKRLVRFRLCPSDTCSSSGCTSNYGDYIVDMSVYLEAWFEAKEVYQSFQCEYLENNVCSCTNEYNSESFDENKCMWDCFSGHNMEGLCMTTNPYGDGSAVADLDYSSYMTCTAVQLSRRRLEEQQRRLDGSYEWDGTYYLGPYCAGQGGSIFIGLFVDDSCSTFVDSTGGRQTYYDLTAKELPYGDTNIVGDMACLSCKEPSTNNNDGDDSTDTDDVSEVCESLYTYAGKCEAAYADVIQYPNNNACNYLEGVKIVRADGTVRHMSTADKTASIFIGVFTGAFVILSAYSYYLKTKLDRATINISEGI